jgi:hypothetical protein
MKLPHFEKSTVSVRPGLSGCGEDPPRSTGWVRVSLINDYHRRSEIGGLGCWVQCIADDHGMFWAAVGTAAALPEETGIQRVKLKMTWGGESRRGWSSPNWVFGYTT